MDRTELVLGSGEVYFDRFIPGTRVGEGERYIGNTLSCQIERRLDFAEARRSLGGIRSRSFRAPTSEDMLLSFITDNISVENMRDWMGGNESRVLTSGFSSGSETVTLKPGRFYQLGKTQFPGIGARNLFGLSVKLADDTYVTTRMYVDEVNGRFGVPASASDLNGLTATVAYEWRSSTSAQIEPFNTAIRGALRFLSRNTLGKNRNYYFPHVLLSPRDQWQLKGNEWQSLTFDADVLQNYVVYESGAVGLSPGEEAIADEGMTLTEFVVAEDVLHGIVNITMPSRGY